MLACLLLQAQAMLSARRFLVLSVGLAVSLATGCNEPTPTESSPLPQDNLGTATDAISTTDVMTCAQQWVNLAVPYCGGVNGGTDYICGGTCSRPHEPWDGYRSDCSGFVSWCWQVPSDPTTNGYMGDVAGTNGWHTVLVADMQAGDAIVCDGHIKLFSKFVSANQAEIYQESDCGLVANKGVETFSKGANNTLTFPGDSRVYHPIRRNGIQPPVRVDGNIDSAAAEVKGWAADLDNGNTSIKTDLSFGGAAGTGLGVQITASDPRPDVAAALHIGPNHGFTVPTPRYYCDGKAHPVHVYGHAVATGSAVEVQSSPKNLTCPPTDVGPGLLRHVTSPAVLTAWSFDVRALLDWMTTADRNAHQVGSDWPDQIVVGRTSDGAVWIVDGTTRRHVTDPASLAAWQFKASAIQTWSATEAAMYSVGLDLPAKPVLAQEVGNPAVYVLDTDPAQPPTTSGSAATGSTSGSGAGGSGTGAGTATGAGGGGGSGASANATGSKSTCSAAPATDSNDGLSWTLGAAAALGIVIARRRRSH